MYKFIKILKDARLFVYIVTIAFSVQMFLAISLEIINGKVNEATLYKFFSLVWAVISLVAFISMYAMWVALHEATKDIKALKEKNLLNDPRREQMVNEPLVPPEIKIAVTEDEMEKMQLLQKVLGKRKRNERNN